MTLIDITPPVSAATPVFPGDTAFSAIRTCNLGEDCPVNVSRIVMSTHTGAHADAPLHYHPAGASIDMLDPAPYIGPCAVVHFIGQNKPVIGQNKPVETAALETALVDIGADIPARILIRTYEKQPATWDGAFTAVSPETIEWLALRGVKLIGVDTPSLDPAESKTMDAHKAIYRCDMRVLEGLMLDDVAPGLYELIAPPLRLEGLDAAPVRALLRTVS